MLKLYKLIENQLHYWEFWEQDKNSGIIHHGIVGDRGDHREVKSGISENFRDKIMKEAVIESQNGFKPIDLRDHITLLIEFSVSGSGTKKDVEKRSQLQKRMDEVLGWTGLGYCDGGSIGSGTMEVCCMVVDFQIAKKVIENDLNGTEFSNYTRIFDENEIS